MNWKWWRKNCSVMHQKITMVLTLSVLPLNHSWTFNKVYQTREDKFLLRSSLDDILASKERFGKVNLKQTVPVWGRTNDCRSASQEKWNISKQPYSHRIQLSHLEVKGLRKANFLVNSEMPIYFYPDSPSPFAVITVNGEQTKSTNPVSSSTSVKWREQFEFVCCSHVC